VQSVDGRQKTVLHRLLQTVSRANLPYKYDIRLTHENRKLIAEKTQVLARIKEENYELSHGEVKIAIEKQSELNKLRLEKQRQERRIDFLKEKIKRLKELSGQGI
jgi:hypothetical protein